MIEACRDGAYPLRKWKTPKLVLARCIRTEYINRPLSLVRQNTDRELLETYILASPSQCRHEGLFSTRE